MPQLPTDEIPRNRYAAGYRYCPQAKAMKPEAAKVEVEVSAAKDTIVFDGQEFAQPMKPIRAD